jgi:hypothetical protein
MVAGFSSNGCGPAVLRRWLPRSTCGSRALRHQQSCDVGSTTSRTDGRSSSADISRNYALTRGALEPIVERVGAGQVTFVFASRELQLNNAVALKEYVERNVVG